MARETIRIEGLEGVLDALRQLPPEMVSKAGGPVKLALKRAAEVILSESRANVRKIIDTPNADNDNRSTGLLLLSLQAKRSRPTQNQRGEAYMVGIKRNQKYPAFRQAKGEVTTAAQIGRQLEYGTEKRRPMPWLRPAFDAKKGQAVQMFSDELNRRTRAVIDRLERIAAAKK